MPQNKTVHVYSFVSSIQMMQDGSDWRVQLVLFYFTSEAKHIRHGFNFQSVPCNITSHTESRVVHSNCNTNQKLVCHHCFKLLGC